MPRLMPFVAALAVALPSLPLAAAPVAAPRVSVATFDQLPQPLPLPYDATANAGAAVAAAKARALKGHKKLLIDLGGNWCLDCRLLAGVMHLPAMHGFIARHYEVVTVDIGRFDKNLAIPARYGIKGRLAGVPALLIVDPKTDRVVNAGRETALADARSLSPQGLADWLAQWV
ncbi:MULTISPECIES: thioredoxin family protein [unclassified Sphingomonas]|jgi:thiol-disulfide isomerase/thioredoxin|uniref:thioredoxin family protein n=1 Tax=unclassified Sphingomonas TaxID=196159 RepID=UPI0025DE67E2|nr:MULTISPECIES: thioredoxin family protein [unclassified Sphingomonas]